MGVAAPRPETEAPLHACLRFLFPGSSAPRLTPYARSADHSWLALPNARAPRMLLPTRPSRATGHAIMRLSAALEPRQRAVRRLAKGVLSTGIGAAVPGRLVIDDVGPHSFVDFLSERFGEEVSVAISVGPARANLKPVLAVFSPAGEPRAFVKVGFPQGSAAAVRREAGSIRSLAHHRFSRLDVPEVIFTDEWNGSPVLAITPLRDPARQVSSARTRLPLSAMAELGNAFAGDPVPLAEVPGWRRLRQQAADGPTSEELAAAMDRLHERHGDQVVRPSAWHGDWTPWNMAWGRDRITLWDWERFEQGVASGLDAFHYSIYSLSETGGFTRQSIETGLERARTIVRPSTPFHRMLSEIYLVTLIARHHEAVGEFAPLSASIARLMLDVLEDSLRTPGHQR